jgi:hypothetical protein
VADIWPREIANRLDVADLCKRITRIDPRTLCANKSQQLGERSSVLIATGQSLIKLKVLVEEPSTHRILLMLVDRQGKSY